MRKVIVYDFFKNFHGACPSVKGCKIIGQSGTEYLFVGFKRTGGEDKVEVAYLNSGDHTTIRSDCIVTDIRSEVVEDRGLLGKKIRPVIHIAIDRPYQRKYV